MDSLGSRVAAYRRRRRMTQQQLADRATVSIDLVRKIEQEQRRTARLDNLHRLAQALDVPVHVLMGKTPGLAANGDQQEVLELRRAIHTPSGFGTDPRPVPELRASLTDAWQLYWTSRYAELARMLPTMLAEARAATHASPDSPDSWTVLAETLQVSASLLAHLAFEDLAHVALLRAVEAAERADAPLLRATLQATTTWVMARQGLWREAEQMTVTSAREIEPTFSAATADQLAVWGELLRYGVTAVARDGRASEAEEMQAMVRAAAAAIGNRRPTLTGVVPFSSTIAGMSAVGIAVATDEPRRALHLADQVTDMSAAPLSIQARYLLNVAFAQTMDWRNTEAVQTLRRAEQLAPEALPNQTIARAIVDELLPRRSQQRLPGLVEIAERIGASTAN